MCSSLVPGQIVCCSSGTLPDITPKPQEDGTCATHTVAPDESCSSVSATNSITVENIESWNGQTWQFLGCDNLQVGQVICVSSGASPMPAAVEGAVCGPQVPGTAIPSNMSDPGALESLNPCPLKGKHSISRTYRYTLTLQCSMLQHLGSMWFNIRLLQPD